MVGAFVNSPTQIHLAAQSATRTTSFPRPARLFHGDPTNFLGSMVQGQAMTLMTRSKKFEIDIKGL